MSIPPVHPGYTCPICGRQSPLQSPLPALYPFCSDRCKMVDLGRWFRGQYAVNRDLTLEEIADMPPEPRA